MIGQGYIPPPIDVEQELANYYTGLEIDSKLNAKIKNLFPVGNIYITTDKDKNPNNFLKGNWNLITEQISDEIYLNMYFNTSNLSIINESNGSKWLQLYYYHYTNSGKSLFSTLQQALKCNASNKISNLYLLLAPHELFLNNDKYEFKLVFPETSLVQHWRQSSNPLKTCSSIENVTNYEAISIGTTTNSWGGLSLENEHWNTTDYCLLAGSHVTTNWFYAIAPYEAWEGAVPGYNSAAVQATALYVRIPGLENKENLLKNINLLNQPNIYIWQRGE